jgi:hypothetical protein
MSQEQNYNDLFQNKVGEFYISKYIMDLKREFDIYDYKKFMQTKDEDYFTTNFKKLEEWQKELVIELEHVDIERVLYDLSDDSSSISVDFIKKYRKLNYSYGGFHWYYLFDNRKSDDLKINFPKKYKNYLIMKKIYDDLINEDCDRDDLAMCMHDHSGFTKLDGDTYDIAYYFE